MFGYSKIKNTGPIFRICIIFRIIFPIYIKVPYRGSKSSHIEKLKKSRTSRNTEELGGISLLGSQKTQYPSEYNPSILETFDSKYPNSDYFAKFICLEFTSLCPMTGQPDFATIHIRYIPSVKIVGSKSLKLYLFSFRNHGDFHEGCTDIIMSDLIKLMDPKHIEVCGEFTPRDGITIHSFANYGKPKIEFETLTRECLFKYDAL